MKAVLIVLLLCTPGWAALFGRSVVRYERQVCTSGDCQKSVSTEKIVVRARGNAQAIAETKAAHMAATGSKGHVLRSLGFGGGNFEGCGWSTSGNVPTCTPRGGAKLIADATAQGRDGRYRVRIWVR